MKQVTRIKATTEPLKVTTAINVADLHTVLEATQTVVLAFPDDKRMKSYRSMIYTINRQGEFTYRTLRNPEDHRELVVWRMK